MPDDNDYDRTQFEKLWNKKTFEELAMAPAEADIQSLKVPRYIMQAKLAIETWRMTVETQRMTRETERMAEATRLMAMATFAMALATAAMAAIDLFD